MDLVREPPGPPPAKPLQERITDFHITVRTQYACAALYCGLHEQQGQASRVCPVQIIQQQDNRLASVSRAATQPLLKDGSEHGRSNFAAR